MRSTQRVIRAIGVCSAVVAAAGCATSAVFEQELAKTNTQTVLAFEETVYNKHQVQAAFNHYVGPTYKQHDGGLPDGKDAAIRALTELVGRQFPNSHRVVERTIAQDDLVAAQVFWDQRPGQTPGINEVDIFRLEDGRIVEHWNVVQAAPAHQASGAAPQAFPRPPH